VDYNRSTEFAEMHFLRPKEAESEERKQTTEMYLWFIYGEFPYFKLQMSRDRIIVNINWKVCESK